MRLYRGPYLSLGRESEMPVWIVLSLESVPSKIGEATWTLLRDNMWVGRPFQITRLVRLP